MRVFPAQLCSVRTPLVSLTSPTSHIAVFIPARSSGHESSEAACAEEEPSGGKLLDARRRQLEREREGSPREKSCVTLVTKLQLVTQRKWPNFSGVRREASKEFFPIFSFCSTYSRCMVFTAFPKVMEQRVPCRGGPLGCVCAVAVFARFRLTYLTFPYERNVDRVRFPVLEVGGKNEKD